MLNRRGGRIPTEPELRLFSDKFNAGYEEGANVGFRNWHPFPWVFRAVFCTFVFVDSQTELLLEGPSAAGVCGNGHHPCWIFMMASSGRRSFRGTRQTFSIRSITLW